jgi:glyoxylase-like metal-dependent hydrolase (beta-lactamase superfamily II)
MRRLLVAIVCAALPCSGFAASSTPEYSIQAIRYAYDQTDAANLVIGASPEQLKIAMIVWLVRGGGRNVLFDSGFHRDTFLKHFHISDYIRPDEAVKLAGVRPEEITDIVISHAHWDHLGGIDLFPKATVWVQRDEFRYYTGEAWQPDGDHDGIDRQDVEQLVRLNTEGRLRLVNGDDVELFPGVRAYTGGRHTYASQYIGVEGTPTYVLASDNVYLYRNLLEHRASATFSDADHAANVRNQDRMIELAGSADRVVPGHDALEFEKFPTEGRVAKIK